MFNLHDSSRVKLQMHRNCSLNATMQPESHKYKLDTIAQWKFVAGARDLTWPCPKFTSLDISITREEISWGSEVSCPWVYQECNRGCEVLDSGDQTIRSSVAINASSESGDVKNIALHQPQMRKNLPNWTVIAYRGSGLFFLICKFL